MEDLDPSKQYHLFNNFCAMANGIAEGLSASQSAIVYVNWTKWAEFYQDKALDALFVSYRDPVPILNTFARQYRTGSLSPSGHQVRSHTVEDTVQSIGQDLSNMGGPYPHLTS